MYNKWYVKNNKVAFYEKGVEIDGRVYGIHSDVDIQKIKRRIAMRSVTDEDGNIPDDVDINAEIAKIEHTDVTFDVPSEEQLGQISSREVTDSTSARELIDAVLSGEVSQDEINAMLLLELAELKAGVGDE